MWRTALWDTGAHIHTHAEKWDHMPTVLTCKVAYCFSHHDFKVVHDWSLAPKWPIRMPTSNTCSMLLWNPWNDKDRRRMSSNGWSLGVSWMCCGLVSQIFELRSWEVAQVVPLAARSKFCYNGSINLTRNRALFANSILSFWFICISASGESDELRLLSQNSQHANRRGDAAIPHDRQRHPDPQSGDGLHGPWRGPAPHPGAQRHASTFFEDEDGRGTAVADCLGNGKVQEAWLSYWQVMTFDMTCHAPVLD